MKCTATLGYDGAVHLVGESGHSGWFHPGRSTITGSRDRKGNVRALSAPALQRLLGIQKQLKQPYDSVELDDDKGIFSEIGPVDIWQNRHAYYCVNIPIRVLMGACRLMKEKT